MDRLKDQANQARCQQLATQGFDASGIALLERKQLSTFFLATAPVAQRNIAQQIVAQVNDTGAFCQTYQKQPELLAVADESLNFTVLAQRANLARLANTAQSFLAIGNDLLALARGVAKSGLSNLLLAADCSLNPISAVGDLVCLIGKIGYGIGYELSQAAGLDAALKLDGLEQWSTAVKQHFGKRNAQLYALSNYLAAELQTRPREEILEKIGGWATDALFVIYGGKLTPGFSKPLAMLEIARYEPLLFAKLGTLGREIQRVVGLSCSQGVRKLKKGLDALTNHPQLLPTTPQPTAQTIAHSYSTLKASNRYLQKVARQRVKAWWQPELRYLQVGQQLKKLPAACVAKTKQVLGDEAVVVDTYGNQWRSKLDSKDWQVQLSDQGKQNLVLLNEAVASGSNVIPATKKLGCRFIKFDDEVKKLLKETKQNLKAFERSKQATMCFKDFYSSNISNHLQDKKVHFNGIGHLVLPTIVQNFKKGKLVEKITGFHWDMERRLEKAGVYTLKNCQELIGGMYQGDLIFGGLKKDGKTFFPSHWNHEMLLNKISEACHNAYKIILRPKGIIEIRGIVEEGFEIVVKLNKRGKILTVYPALSRKL